MTLLRAKNDLDDLILRLISIFAVCLSNGIKKRYEHSRINQVHRVIQFIKIGIRFS